MVELLKTLIKRKQVEMTGTSWAHAILPLMTVEETRRDLKRYLETAERVLGIRPVGFFPPELSIDPLMPLLLTENGYRWCFVENGLLRYTTGGWLNVANDFKPRAPVALQGDRRTRRRRVRSASCSCLRKMKKSLTSLTDLSPIVWNGAGAVSIVAFRSFQEWNTYTLSCLGRMAIMKEKRLYAMLDKTVGHLGGFFFPLSGDFEFYGYRGNVLDQPIPVSRLQGLLEYIHQNPHMTFTLPSEYLKKTNVEGLQSLYLRSGSWSSDDDFALWDADPDNKRLNDFVREVRDLYYRVGPTLGKKDREMVEKYLLLSQGSDGRGWTPIPEHRLFCYNAALSALRILEK